MLLFISIFIFAPSAIVSAQDCQDIDSSTCQKMSVERPDLCSDPAVAHTACPRFCNTCLIFAPSAIVSAQDCQDIDSSACQIMSVQRPNLCSDPAIASTACPSFCNLCPVKCYHCNATLQDYHLCNTTMNCPEGHMCMRKELKSVADGHHEYEMTCASKQECDDPWNSLSAFGKRNIEPRDVSVTCCADDLCNYPEQTTIPPSTTSAAGCIRDLVFVVDESNSLAHYESRIQNFLHAVVSQLPVSETEVHVSLGFFSTHSRTAFDLDAYHSKNEVLRALSTHHLHGGSGDVNAGLGYVLDHALTPSAGDRKSASNVVVIITDDGTHDSALLNSLEHKVHTEADVISVVIGHVAFSHLASDAFHQFRLRSPSELSSIEQEVAKLIC